MKQIATDNCMATLRERVRVIRLGYARALALLLAAFASRAGFARAAFVWASSAGFACPGKAAGEKAFPSAALFASFRAERLRARAKRVSHACCKLNKAPPLSGVSTRS